MHSARLLAIGFALACSQALAPAQSGGNYQITSAVIAGGGGTSSGGNFNLQGTIGQPDAGTLSGGTYTLAGGFWSQLAVVETPGSPQLILQVAASQVTLTWPNQTGFTLQETSLLNGPATLWNRVDPGAYRTAGTNLSVSLSLNPGMRYYRLQKP